MPNLLFRASFSFFIFLTNSYISGNLSDKYNSFTHKSHPVEGGGGKGGTVNEGGEKKKPAPKQARRAG